MKKHFMMFLSCSLLLTACFDKDSRSASANSQLPAISLNPLFSDLSFQRPVAAIQDSTNNWFIVEQAGKIYRIPANTQDKKLFLDLSKKIKSRGEMGLLGLALDPNFKHNGIFYISYTAYDNYSYISRMYSSEYDVDLNAEEVVLKLPQPYANHNGGQISFGPDSYLYIGFGDGGSAGDPEKNGQNTQTLLGALLRINVNNAKTYSIPDDNPFITTDGRDEIFAYGLRNPWRWSFDKVTGDLWLADVGQNEREEINIIKRGGNYGWNIMEGKQCFTVAICKPEKYISPIYDYGHDLGQAITGGYVYRGVSFPELSGYYVYGDFVSGKLWALKQTDKKIENNLLANTSFNISSFAQANNGEIYVIDYNGKIYAINKK